MHKEELNNFYFSVNIISVIESRRMKLAGKVAHLYEKKNACPVLGGKI